MSEERHEITNISILKITGQNVDSMIFKEVMHELARKLGHLGKDFTDT